MTRAAYARLYTVLASFCLLLSLSVHMLTQGGGSLAQLPGLDGGQPVISAYFTVMATGLLLFATGALAVLHMRAAHSEQDEMSVPVPALPLIGLGDTADRVDHARRSTRLYAGIVFVMFAFLPTFSLVHLARVVADRGIVWSINDPAAVRAVCTMGVNWPLVSPCAPEEKAQADHMAGRLALAETRCDVAWARAGGPPPTGHCAGPHDRSVACEDSVRRCGGVDWLPVGSPTFIIAFSVAGILGFLSQGLLLFGWGRAALRRLKLL